ncbi:hypothetical protein [Halodesulfovibrio sp.]|jgi:hypothetical protein|uniref:hypothetical protein n=1 Tax=Halodesulfovibrio sp. TaxID=1912772 RepID=UPI0025DCC824|nr:hypothetical protein [Halodesulfovibrio sp.]MCT4627506.1 hypothetical protein [Halodesulfovibrio sp.]
MTWNAYFKEKFDREISNGSIDPTILPPENIFILSIDELCLLALCAYNNDGSYLKILQEAIKLNSDPKTSAFFITSHFSKWKLKSEHLPFIETEAEKLYAQIESRF